MTDANAPGDPSFRRDLVTGRWVLIAPHRRGSPRDFMHETSLVRDAATCPFCPGHERNTAATTAERTGADGQWIARSFHNLYPMVAHAASLPVTTAPTAPVRTSSGFHEVVVETPAHGVDLSDLDDAHARAVIDLYRERLAHMATHPEARAVAMFKNRGPRAGASLYHAHGQVVSLPIVPPGVRRRDFVSARHHQKRGVGALAASRDAELTAGVRVIERTGHFVVYCPFAPHRSNEIWIVPLDASPSLVRAPAAVCAELGPVLTRTLRRMRAVTADADHNVIVRTPALAHWDAPWALWHVEVLPRRGGDAGYELSTGTQCVLMPPEESAALLRDAKV